MLSAGLSRRKPVYWVRVRTNILEGEEVLDRLLKDARERKAS